MARPREFDIDQALERAMNVFWTKGYEGASLQDLLDAMNIARGSLYKAFEDKHSVYLAALDRYDRTEIQRAVDGCATAAPATAPRASTGSWRTRARPWSSARTAGDAFCAMPPWTGRRWMRVSRPRFSP